MSQFKPTSYAHFSLLTCMGVKPNELGLLWGYLSADSGFFRVFGWTFLIPCFEQRSNNVQKWAACISRLEARRLVFDSK
jgi:hypothetical protein